MLYKNNNIERHSCPLCGEEFLNEKFENSEEAKIISIVGNV